MKFNNNIILVTGANGFVGRHLCKRLYPLGGTVVGLVRRETTNNKFLKKQYVVDISDREKLDKIIMKIKPNIVIHLAGKKFNNSTEGYISSYKTNLIGSLNLISSCQKIKNLNSFIYIGSCEEYGKQTVPFHEKLRESPVSSYGCSKLSVTQLLQSLSRSFEFPSMIIRPSVIYGPGQSNVMFIPSLINTLLKGNNFDMTLGDQTRDFIFIDDLVEAIILSCNVNELNAKVVNVSSGNGVYIKKVTQMIANLITPYSINLINFGRRHYDETEIMNYYASSSLAYEVLKWRPKVSLEVGLKRTLSYYRKLNNINRDNFF